MTVLMGVYSLMLLLLVFLVGSPYWLFRMLTSGRYRTGFAGRLGLVPAELRRVASGRNVVWLHAVSVGEVLAATRLVRELEDALNAPEAMLAGGWIILVSTTTATGQALARERFRSRAAGVTGITDVPPGIFWYPLDFAWAVRGYLRALRPKMLVLMESEIWPRLIFECNRAGIPVAVVNARVSDRSFARGSRVRHIWGRVIRKVSLFAVQSHEDGRRLEAMGARTESVFVAGNLKYDVQPPRASRVADEITKIAAGRQVIVAGSTVAGERGGSSEDELLLQGWKAAVYGKYPSLLVIAPRHPERFTEVATLLSGTKFVRASELVSHRGSDPEIVLLDTIGDLAAVYSVSSVAFVGGSLVPRGGHNPLEAARFGIPVVTGPFTTNFREVYGKLAEVGGLVTVASAQELGAALAALLANPVEARELGKRGRTVFVREQGATAHTVEALLQVLRKRRNQWP